MDHHHHHQSPSVKDSSDTILHDFRPFFVVHKDGRVEKFKIIDNILPVPPSVDPATGVESLDVIVSPSTGVSARIFLPKAGYDGPKLPLLVHYHGGGFCAGSPFDTASHGFLAAMVSKANVIAISIDYRLAPEHPLPAAYNDSFEALRWIASAEEPTLTRCADLGRTFLVGESAGANIAVHAAIRAGAMGLTGVKIVGMLVMHPFFGGKDVDKMYKFMCPTSSGKDDDPKLNPGVDPNLERMVGERVLVCVASRDWLRPRGVEFYEMLRRRWGGKVKLEETEEDHCFYLFKMNDKAMELIGKMVDFIGQD